MGTTQLSKETNRNIASVQLWCLNNKIAKHKGKYTMNPLEVEMFKAQMRGGKRVKQIKKRSRFSLENIKHFRALDRRNDQIKEEKKIKAKLKRLEIMVRIAELDLEKNAYIKKLNETPDI